MLHVLLLGGTSEAAALARALGTAGIRAVYSLAGRTAQPAAVPIPTRTGGFGGLNGLRDYLRDAAISHVVDATHPFAAQMSRNAGEACASLGLPLLRWQRQPWLPGPGDHWQRVPDVAAAVTALPEAPSRVFLAIGRQLLSGFAARPRHHYLLRLVDPPGALPLPDCRVIVARGPFDLAGDLALLRDHAIGHIVAKDAGGDGARAKLDAARMLGLPVILIDRPAALPAVAQAGSVAEVLRWLGHPADLGV